MFLIQLYGLHFEYNQFSNAIDMTKDEKVCKNKGSSGTDRAM